LQRADVALSDGDLGRYQTLVDQARQLLEASSDNADGEDEEAEPA